jgi:hypothetical protein
MRNHSATRAEWDKKTGITKGGGDDGTKGEETRAKGEAFAESLVGRAKREPEE